MPAPVQLKPAAHGCDVPHAWSSAANATHCMLLASHAWDDACVVAHAVSFAHESPGWVAAAHVPHALPGTMAQKLL
jgi:hypothetical protein